MNLKKLSTILCLINSRIIYEEEEAELNIEANQFLLNSVNISQEKFMSLVFWFEKDENISSLTCNLSK